MKESVHEPLKTGFSVPYSSMIFLDIIHSVFQSLAFRGPVSLVKDIKVELPDVEHKPLLLRMKFCVFETPPNCELPCLGCGF